MKFLKQFSQFLIISLLINSFNLTIADNYPNKPINLVISFSPGSGVDVIARQIQEPLEKQLGQPIIFNYKAGAAGNIGSEFVAKSKPDGYTLLLGTSASHGSNAAIYKNLNFDVEEDFVPIAPIIDVSNVLTINPDVIKVKNLKEFVNEVKDNPNKYYFASTGIGTGTHMAFAEFNYKLDLKMIHIPYNGGPKAISGVLAGEVCCIMNQVQTVLPHYKNNKVKLLGITTINKIDIIKEVPTIASSKIKGTENFNSSIWFGLFAPKNTDIKIVKKINRAINEIFKDQELKTKIENQGNLIRLENHKQFKETVHNDKLKWAEIVKKANIKIE